MVRLSRQTKQRHVSNRRPKKPQAKTGPKKDTLQKGYKEHENALSSRIEVQAFIPQIR